MDGKLQHSTCVSFQIPTATLENDFTTPLVCSIPYTNIGIIKTGTRVNPQGIEDSFSNVLT